jgi:hypothetical protein
MSLKDATNDVEFPTKESMSLKNATKNVYSYLPQTGCNCWTLQGMWNFPPRKPVAKMMVEEGEIDKFLQFLGTLHL